ncbi:hypothetical protein LX36DRAFT_64033 [Colletotrichum falcatum]|nr:hypothetical protein LX36DRAFT_64033 [Colletotrichum falcatum]
MPGCGCARHRMLGFPRASSTYLVHQVPSQVPRFAGEGGGKPLVSLGIPSDVRSGGCVREGLGTHDSFLAREWGDQREVAARVRASRVRSHILQGGLFESFLPCRLSRPSCLYLATYEVGMPALRLAKTQRSLNGNALLPGVAGILQPLRIRACLPMHEAFQRLRGALDWPPPGTRVLGRLNGAYGDGLTPP